MGGRKRDVFKLMRDITKDAETQESYGTGLMGEAIIISSYKKMKIADLEKMRFIINKIIKKKKEIKRAHEKKTKMLEV